MLAQSQVVDEGESAIFEIVSDENLSETITVKYVLQPEGDFFSDIDSNVRDLVLPKTQQISEVQVNTVNDNLAEQDGAITLSLIDGEDYDLSIQNSARIVISDLADRQKRVEEITYSQSRYLTRNCWINWGEYSRNCNQSH